MITDNLSSHNSKSTRAWLEDPRIKHAFIPVRACWLNLQEAWWRVFRREALAGQTFTDSREIDQATRPGHHRPQRPSTTMGLGPTRPETQDPTPPVCLSPLRTQH
ncbi:transposase [Nocardia sp. NBC_01730]|uniref:transposase n=1 Tax=Nocardia sp. NBC_01730 TaxID=2975998 RepID=UPI003FA36C82